MMAKCQVNYVLIVMAIMYIVRPAGAPASQRDMEYKRQLICAKHLALTGFSLRNGFWGKQGAYST